MIKEIILGDNKGILGINRRNIQYVYPGNSRKYFFLVNEKLKTKELLKVEGIPVPETYLVFEKFKDIINLRKNLSLFDNFVIKPNKGKGGNGILILGKKCEDGYLNVKNKMISFRTIRKSVADILLGVFSYGMNDSVVIEKRIFPSDFLKNLYSQGLADIRIITYYGKPVMGMVRVPTDNSNGKANLHQGGVGVGLDIISGETTYAIYKGKFINRHPDSNANLIGLYLPFFKEIIEMCGRFPKKIPLNYLGFDFSIDKKKGPMVIEINARPGLEIQNANMMGLLNKLSKVG